MAKFDHERAHMAANLVSDPPVYRALLIILLRCYKLFISYRYFNKKNFAHKLASNPWLADRGRTP